MRCGMMASNNDTAKSLWWSLAPHQRMEWCKSALETINGYSGKKPGILTKMKFTELDKPVRKALREMYGYLDDYGRPM